MCNIFVIDILILRLVTHLSIIIMWFVCYILFLCYSKLHMYVINFDFIYTLKIPLILLHETYPSKCCLKGVAISNKVALSTNQFISNVSLYVYRYTKEIR